MSLLEKPAMYKNYSCPFFNEWESPLITNSKIPDNKGRIRRDLSCLAPGPQPVSISGAILIQLEPKCAQVVGASAQHPLAFTGCWCRGSGAVQGCSREDSCLGSVNLPGVRKRQLVSQNLPRGAGWFMCFVFLFHGGETFFVPLGQGCHVTLGSTEQQLWGSGRCRTVAALASLGGEKEKKPHFQEPGRLWTDHMNHLTSTELHLLAWVISFLWLKGNFTL